MQQRASIMKQLATYVLKPASFFSSPDTLITTNFLKSFVDVGLLCPEFHPHAINQGVCLLRRSILLCSCCMNAIVLLVTFSDCDYVTRNSTKMFSKHRSNNCTSKLSKETKYGGMCESQIIPSSARSLVCYTTAHATVLQNEANNFCSIFCSNYDRVVKVSGIKETSFH